MFDVLVTAEIVAYAKKVLAEHNFGRRGEADGNPQQQLTGLIGQIKVQDLFGYPRTRGNEGPDGGVDLVFHGLSIDVKTMGRKHRPRPEWVSNFTALQQHFPTDVLLFCSFNQKMRILTVCGWTLKDLLLRDARRYPKGACRLRDDGRSITLRSDLYEIRNQDLFEAKSLAEMKDNLYSISLAEGRCDCAVCIANSTFNSGDRDEDIQDEKQLAIGFPI